MTERYMLYFPSQGGAYKLDTITGLTWQHRGAVWRQLDDEPAKKLDISSSEWQALQAALLNALYPYPEARDSVAQALRDMGIELK